VKFQCPAKINLFLEVTGKRPDGYHRLATLFAKINLYDVLDMTADQTGEIKLSIEAEDGLAPLSAGEDNLVMRAARAFYKTFRIGQGVTIVLTKRIPMGAGLGGGSSDAAGTLLGLAKLFDIKLDAAKRLKLHKIAVSLGADVPFFLRPEVFCVGKGIGDQLKPVALGKSLPYMVLVHPGLHVATPAAFKALERPTRPVVLTRLSQLDKLITALKRSRPVDEWGGLLFNRLEEAKLPVLEQVAQARSILERAGARYVRMSGSGSSVFGFVSSFKDGEECVKRLQGYPWKVYLTCCNG
jgi:4-diphosphocytidyl-2-C-methyl-D-erythritol kinase